MGKNNLVRTTGANDGSQNQEGIYFRSFLITQYAAWLSCFFCFNYDIFIFLITIAIKFQPSPDQLPLMKTHTRQTHRHTSWTFGEATYSHTTYSHPFPILNPSTRKSGIMPDLKYDTEIWQRQQNRSHDSFGAVKSPVYKLLSLGTESRQLRVITEHNRTKGTCAYHVHV